MFTLALRAEFTHTVPVMTPVDGTHREDTFRARFAVVSAEEQADLLSANDDGETFLRKIVIGIEDVVDAEGKPVAFSPELLTTMLGLRWVRLGLIAAYSRAVTKIKTGN